MKLLLRLILVVTLITISYICQAQDEEDSQPVDIVEADQAEEG